MISELNASLSALRRKRIAFLNSLNGMPRQAVDLPEDAVSGLETPRMADVSHSAWKTIVLAAAAGVVAGLLLGKR